MQGHKQSLATLPDRTLILLSEITAGTSRHDSGESGEAALMRLIPDPLLLRSHMLDNKESSFDKVGPRQIFDRRLLAQISYSSVQSTVGVQGEERRYPSAYVGQVNSLYPEPYTASAEDLNLALEIDPGSNREKGEWWADREARFSGHVFSVSLRFLLTALLMAIVVGVLLG